MRLNNCTRMSNLHVMRHKRRQAMRFNQAMTTKNMQKKILNIQKCLKSIRYMILGTLRAFVQWHVAMIARHSLQLVMTLNLDVDFMTLTKNHKAHPLQKKFILVFILVKVNVNMNQLVKKLV